MLSRWLTSIAGNWNGLPFEPRLISLRSFYHQRTILLFVLELGEPQWRCHGRACQGICPARNASALPAALAVKATMIRSFIKCKIMALWLTELRKIFEYKPGLKHKIRVSNIRRKPNLIALRDAGSFYSWFTVN